jgi:hypothetical protein
MSVIHCHPEGAVLWLYLTLLIHNLYDCRILERGAVHSREPDGHLMQRYVIQRLVSVPIVAPTQ